MFVEMCMLTLHMYFHLKKEIPSSFILNLYYFLCLYIIIMFGYEGDIQSYHNIFCFFPDVKGGVNRNYYLCRLYIKYNKIISFCLF